MRFFLLFILLPCFSQAQDITVNPQLLDGHWNAHWVACPDFPAQAYGVFHFRKEFRLNNVPERFIIHVSADNRYHLFVNGKSVGRGPARSTRYNWNFGSYDIASYLDSGDNVIAAQVWNMGEYAPVAQLSQRTGFLVQGNDTVSEKVNTDGTWKVLHDTAYAPTSLNAGAVLHSYVAVGACDKINGKYYPWGWKKQDYDASGWENAKIIHTPVVTSGYGSDNIWTLSPRTIPQMEEKMQRIKEVRRNSGVEIKNNFLLGNHPVTIPAHSDVTILLDQTFVTMGYPVLKVSGGKGAK